ncbi:hypothetical protein MKX42_26515 [Paenibacillus sp. FSL R7-0204]|uniref:hypothetical protein n=1 Tax=Paenibacillus sp. FSL R7-0204 TaxID=2921675 RepID=UPI0030F9C32F
MKLLPLVHSRIDSLPHHSYIMSILEVGNPIEWIILDRYFQLKIDEYKNEVVVLDYCEDDFLSFTQLKESSYLLKRNEITENIVDFVIKYIEKGFYIFLHVDEFYLPFTSSYMKRQFGHGVMIHGYNENDCTFNIAGYDLNNKLSFNLIRYSQLSESYDKLSDYFEHNDDEYLKKIFMLKPKSVEHSLNKDLLIGLINEYTTSINTQKNFVKDYYSNCDTYFGISVYRVLIKYYQLAIQNDNIQLLTKNLYVLLEHKRIMKTRVESILGNIGEEQTRIINCLKIIINDLQIAVNLNTRLQLTNDKKNIIKIIEILERVYLLELDYLDRFLQLIKVESSPVNQNDLP